MYRCAGIHAVERSFDVVIRAHAGVGVNAATTVVSFCVSLAVCASLKHRLVIHDCRSACYKCVKTQQLIQHLYLVPYNE